MYFSVFLKILTSAHIQHPSNSRIFVHSRQAVPFKLTGLSDTPTYGNAKPKKYKSESDSFYASLSGVTNATATGLFFAMFRFSMSWFKNR